MAIEQISEAINENSQGIDQTAAMSETVQQEAINLDQMLASLKII